MEHAPPFPLLWPRRTAGSRLRVVALVGPEPDPAAAESLAALAALPDERFDLTLALCSGAALPSARTDTWPLRDGRTIALGQPAEIGDAKRIAQLDPDVLVDLAGNATATGPLLARRVARTIVTVDGIANPNVPPLVDRAAIPVPALGDALDALQRAIVNAEGVPDAASMTALWEDAVRAHQQGARDAARDGYARVLDLQAGYAPAHYLLGLLLRDGGELDAARTHLTAAVEAAPGFVDARVAAANAGLAAGDPQAAIALCIEGLARTADGLPLYRALGMAQLAARDGVAAAAAFEHALALAPDDAETHYNHGVALQMQRDAEGATRSYQRALALAPDLVAASFNLGVLHQERGAYDAALAAYEQALRADPANVAAYRNVGEVLFAAGRLDAWFANFRRFEMRCPDALPLAVQALEACHYLADFTRLESYLEGIARGRFAARDAAELVDSLEQLLYLLLYFDVEPETMLRLAHTYDATAQRVYGTPLPRRAVRRPGRLRIGYLSADLRNHVMGKMMWQAVQHHDKARFELFFYSLTAAEDEWTARFRGLADRFESIASLTEREAAARIAADDLDLLVDLSAHTKGAKPGILALKPARVQITHVASAGTVGLSAVDFKLTDHYADRPESQAFQLETMLPMDGCVYPYRHVPAVAAHPFRRESLGIAPDAVVIGAFVSGLKLSRRCLGIWRDVLARVPRAVLAFSPVAAAQRPLYARLTGAAGIAAERIVFLPQGRDDGENQARYELVDFVLDPMPYGGVNGTLEALDMGVPVVTLLGGRHCERTSYSILANLGVAATVAHSGTEYVEIAVRLADDDAFMREVRAAIATGLRRSPLTDLTAHTRALERAYVQALAARAPEALRDAAARDPDDARGHNRQGILLADSGDIPRAIEAFASAVRLDPTYARAWSNLGNALRSAGRADEALAALQHAVAAQPGYALGWSNLGAVQRDLGDNAGAEVSLRRALALAPEDRVTLTALAGILRAQGRLDEAITHYTDAARRGPPDAGVLLPLAGALAERDDLAPAQRAYRDARAANPRSLRAAFGEALTLPMVCRDAAAVAEARAAYTRGLARLEDGLEALVRNRSFGDVIDDLRWTNFLLAYQGEDDRELQSRYAALVGRAIDAVGPQWRTGLRPGARGARIRIGFASAFFNDGTVGRYFRSWLVSLDRARFEICVYPLRPEPTPYLRELAPRVDRVRTFVGSIAPSAIAPVIRGDALDVLVYPELGMDGTTFALAALRLAPVQCAGWGHPVTTGHATVDAFFSCAAMEPADGARHYTERLVTLPGIGTAYARPSLPPGAVRSSIGLPENVPLFLCPQSLFKIHPDNDALFARVLAAAPAAKLVLFEGRHAALTAKYRERFGAALAREGLRSDERVIVLPQCGHDDYLRINGACDAMLDTLRWSGGNTSLDALASGLPIVTLPGRYMRGRQSAGMLALAGIAELVAHDETEYVAIAARLAADRAWRDALREQIREGHARLFDDTAPVRAFGDAIEALVGG